MQRKDDGGGGGGGGGGETNIEKKTQQQLPQDLIIEILLRLRVKSLSRFKCVCKSWLSLISDPHFATSHFDLTTVAHTHRLVFITNRASEARTIDLQASLYDVAAITSLKLDFWLPRSYLNVKIGGSCRGFLFLYCHEGFYLWNPSTGVHKPIPSSPIVSGLGNSYVTYLYGFGYDPSMDDYLVVLGFYNAMWITRFEFFSLRANIWKEIEGAYLPYTDACLNHKAGTLFNGAIHWLAHRVNTPMIVIVSFDLTERRISDIALPDAFEFYNPLFYDLWVFRGFMSLWALVDDAVDIWVMEEHGVSSSWTKILVLSIDEDFRLPFYPICSTNYGNIVASNDNTVLGKYTDDGQLLEHRYFCNHVSQVAFYTESLLTFPPPRDPHQT